MSPQELCVPPAHFTSKAARTVPRRYSRGGPAPPTNAPPRGAGNCAPSHHEPHAGRGPLGTPGLPPGARGTACPAATNRTPATAPKEHPEPRRGAGNCAPSHDEPHAGCGPLGAPGLPQGARGTARPAEPRPADGNAQRGAPRTPQGRAQPSRDQQTATRSEAHLGPTRARGTPAPHHRSPSHAPPQGSSRSSPRCPSSRRTSRCRCRRTTRPSRRCGPARPSR